MPGPFVLVQQDVPLRFPVSHCMQSHDRRYTVQKTSKFTSPLLRMVIQAVDLFCIFTVRVLLIWMGSTLPFLVSTATVNMQESEFLTAYLSNGYRRIFCLTDCLSKGYRHRRVFVPLPWAHSTLLRVVGFLG